MSEFQKWWDETYGQILTITNDLDADASCRIAKIAAMDAWMAGRAAIEAERDALRKDAERYQWVRDTPVSVGRNMILVERTGTMLDCMIDAAIAAKEPK